MESIIGDVSENQNVYYVPIGTNGSYGWQILKLVNTITIQIPKFHLPKAKIPKTKIPIVKIP